MKLFNLIFTDEEKETIENVLKTKQEILKYENSKMRSDNYQLMEKLSELEKLSEENQNQKTKMENIIKNGPSRLKYLTILYIIVPTLLVSVFTGNPINNAFTALIFTSLSGVLIHMILIMLMTKITPKLIQKYAKNNDFSKVSQFLKEIDTNEEKISYLTTYNDLNQARKVTGLKHGIIEEEFN